MPVRVEGRPSGRVLRRAAVAAASAAMVSILAGCLSFKERQEDRFILEASEAPAEVIARRGEQADAAYLAPRTVEGVEESLRLSLSAVAPSNGYRGLWQAARACAWLAEAHPRAERRESYARRGVAIAREAVRVAGDRVEPHFFLAMNLGRVSQIYRTARFVKEMGREAELAIARDERFDRAGPHRFLGILHLRTEGKIFVGFGDLDKALRHLARAVELCPDDAENRLAHAEALIADEDYAGARRQLDAAAELPAPLDLTAERAGWLKRIAELREQIRGE